MKRICIAAIAAALLAGCQTMSQNETAGALLGGVAGAVLGNQFGSGDGRVAMTAIGAVIGATVGAQIAESLDAASQQQATSATQQALSTAPVGGTVHWDNPSNASGPASGSTAITPGRDRRHGKSLPRVPADHHRGRATGDRCRHGLSSERRHLVPDVASGTPPTARFRATARGGARRECGCTVPPSGLPRHSGLSFPPQGHRKDLPESGPALLKASVSRWERCSYRFS